MSFKKNKYQVIRNAISKELANLAYSYLQISAEADYWMITNQVTHDKNPLGSILRHALICLNKYLFNSFELGISLK